MIGNTNVDNFGEVDRIGEFDIYDIIVENILKDVWSNGILSNDEEIRKRSETFVYVVNFTIKDSTDHILITHYPGSIVFQQYKLKSDLFYRFEDLMNRLLLGLSVEKVIAKDDNWSMLFVYNYALYDKHKNVGCPNCEKGVFAYLKSFFV